MTVELWLLLGALLIGFPTLLFYGHDQPLGELIPGAAIIGAFGLGVAVIGGASHMTSLAAAGLGAGLVLGLIGLPLVLAKISEILWISRPPRKRRRAL